ncbi:MAG TPA: hypothetical protein VI979_03405 [archaeon]|nr:hypothetical protein [archaeon]
MKFERFIFLALAVMMQISTASVVYDLNASSVSGVTANGGGNAYNLLFSITPALGSGLPTVYIIENIGTLEKLNARYAAILAGVKETESAALESRKRTITLQAILEDILAKLNDLKIRNEQLNAWKGKLDAETASIEKSASSKILVSDATYKIIIMVFVGLLAAMALYKLFYRKGGDNNNDDNGSLPDKSKETAPFIEASIETGKNNESS